jgi:hypothetical protein
VCTKLIAFDKSSKMLASEPQGFKQNSSEFNTEAKPEPAPSVPGETVNQEVSILSTVQEGNATTVHQFKHTNMQEDSS